MKVLAVLLVASAVYAAPSNLRAEEVAFGRFVERFSKQYEHDAAQAQAFKNFVENFEVLEKVRAEQPNTQFDMHEWMDEPRETLMVKRFGAMTSLEGGLENVELVTELDKNAKTFTPIMLKNEKGNSHWTWPSTHVKNQGQCGSCWSFATAAIVETMQDLHNHRLDALSEQELIDCDTKSHACNGGFTSTGLDYARTHGLETEGQYPYKARKENCHERKGEATFRQVIQLKSDEHFAYDWVHAHGPTTIIIHAPNELQYYKGGVFHAPGNCNSVNSYHAVSVMGAGEENGQAFWWVKNSWGSGWGEGGYFKLARNANACDMNKNFFTAQF